MTIIEILLVEDNPGDVRLIQEAFNDSKLRNNLSIAYDGVDAMEFLRQEGTHAGASKPDIILLDLNLPRKDGREVLADIKEDPNLRHIPVVILTTSDDQGDIFASYNLHANCYITKPVDVHRFFDIVKTIEGFWFQIVKLPPHLE